MTTCQPGAETENYDYMDFTLNKTELTLKRYVDPAPFVPSNEKERTARCEGDLNDPGHGLKETSRPHRCQERSCRNLRRTRLHPGTSCHSESLRYAGHSERKYSLRHDAVLRNYGQNLQQRSHAHKEAGCDIKRVNIRKAVSTHFEDIGHDPAIHDVTYENSQARYRTLILMDLANKTNGMVIGTGDMSELALGWATYNGDHMSMYGVNASVPKTLVRHLVRYYADTCGDKALADVLNDVLDTPVSPELLPPEDGDISQKTEDLVGPYELHDFFLYYILRYGYHPAKIYRLAKIAFAGVYEGKVIYKWLNTFYRRFFSQQFKRSCLPDGPKVGSVAVSPRGDLRMPSDAARRIWMDEVEKLDPEEGDDHKHKNDQVKAVIELKKKARARNEQGLFVVEGVRMAAELPKDQVKSIYVSETFAKKSGECRNSCGVPGIRTCQRLCVCGDVRHADAPGCAGTCQTVFLRNGRALKE